MIDFKLAVDNPWFFHKQDYKHKDVVVKSGQVSVHKFWEVQITKWEAQTLVKVELDLTWRGRDHAGPRIHLEICGLMLSALIYDHRHWDRDNNCWALSQEETV